MSRSHDDACPPSGAPVPESRTAIIRRLNDQLRRFFAGGHVVITGGIRSLGAAQAQQVLRAVCRFADFTPDNDPHDEHDFGAVEVGGRRVFWKIDHYDLSLEAGSPDPADPAVTTRVLTIMLAEEY